mmetsp:Transcript_14734/g.36035  ORF Transcript_14734/g.36035 Transcript_14734/m.36035 type:complete len:1322 (+) Transcript_14734:643-4608(+)
MKLNFASTTERLFGRDEELELLHEIYDSVKSANRRRKFATTSTTTTTTDGDGTTTSRTQVGVGGEGKHYDDAHVTTGPMFVDLQAPSGDGKTSLANHFGFKCSVAAAIDERRELLAALEQQEKARSFRSSGFLSSSSLLSTTDVTSFSSTQHSQSARLYEDVSNSSFGDEADLLVNSNRSHCGNVNASTRTNNNNDSFQNLIDSSSSMRSLKIRNRHDVVGRYYMKGKFNEQHQKPYAAFVDAFDTLLSSIWKNRENETSRIEAIRNALDADAQSQHLILDIMPQLMKILQKKKDSRSNQLLQPSTASTTSRRFSQNDNLFSLRSEFEEHHCSSSRVPSRQSGADGSMAEQLHQFGYFFRAFVRAVCNGQPHPIILFLDDLQWADVSSLELLKAICRDSESTNLIVIGAYRTHDVDFSRKNQPLEATLNYLKESTSMENRYFELVLGNFELDDLNKFVAASLELTPEKVSELSEVIMRKTDGNIFHVKEYLKHLESEKLLQFNMVSCHWTWDTNEIAGSTDLSENVIALVTSRIMGLPDYTISILKLASCLWFSFDANVLEFIVFQARAKLENCQPISEKTLKNFGVFQANLKVDLATQSEVVRSLELATERGLLDRVSRTSFKFSHDKVREATYGLTAEGEERNHQHFVIGEILWQMYRSKRSQQWMLFSSVDQLNKISSHIVSPDLRVQLARVNLEAAECATSLSAFLPAVVYVKSGIEFLGKSKWVDHYNLCLKLYTKLVALQSSLGIATQTADAIEEAVNNARSFDDKLPLLTTLIESLSVQGKLNESLELGFDILDGLGEHFQKADGRAFQRYVEKDTKATKALLKDHSAASILSLPLLSCEKKQYTLRILTLMIDPAFHTGRLSCLFLIINRMVRISLIHGLGRPSGVAFALWGFSLSSKDGNRRENYEYGRLSVTLQERLKAPEYDCRVLTYVYVLLNHWQEPLGKSLAPLLTAHNAGMTSGDIDYAFQAAGAYITLYWYSGRALGKGIIDSRHYMNLMIDYNQEKSLTIYLPLFQCMANMTSDDWRTAVLLKGEFISDFEFEEKKFANSTMMSYQMQLCYYFGDMDLAESISAKLQEVSKSFNSHYLFVTRLFFFGLIALRIAMSSKGRRKRKQLKIAQKIIQEMEQWTRHGGLNCLHKLLILKAEYNASQFLRTPQGGRCNRGTVMDFRSVQLDYDRAIVTSTRTGFRNDAALAAERAYEFCLQCNSMFLARSYFKQSIQFYREWGASAKVNQMLQESDIMSCSMSLNLEVSVENLGATSVTPNTRQVDHTKLGLSHLGTSDRTTPQTFFAGSTVTSSRRNIDISPTCMPDK